MPAVLPLATIQRPPGRTIADGCRGRIGLIVSMFLLFATLFVPVAGAAEAPPQLFVYPPEYRYTDGGILNSPQTMTIDQITERVSDIPELSGVVLIVYWSTLCPAEIGCDFSLIDKAIEYWKKKQKKIILSVATIGFPIMQPPDRRSVIGASPDWVMKKIRTYSFTTRLLGNIPLNSTTNFVLPDFRDPEFLRLGGELIRNLALRYDGNPTIARVRIATGAMGEENPIVGPLSKPLAGYAERQWIDYCDAVITQYERAFKKSELEFDISRLPWVRAIGSPTN